MKFNPDEIHQRLIEAGESWADKFAAAELLEDACETMLAKCFLQATGNVEERKARAKTDDEYRGASRNAVEARRNANKAKVKYDSAKAWCDLVRTAESTRRAEIEKGL